MRVAKTIELDAQTERELRVLSQRKRIEVRLQQRARIVLLAAKGMQNKDIAVEVGLDRRQVSMWRDRFLEGGIDALRSALGSEAAALTRCAAPVRPPVPAPGTPAA